MALPPKSFSKKQRLLASLTAAAFFWASAGAHRAIASNPWTLREDSFTDDNWGVLRSSADGSKLVGTLFSQDDSLVHVKYSSDAGVTWTDITPNDPDVDDADEFDPESGDVHYWSSADISSDGNIIMLTDYNGDSGHSYIWYSPNHGTYWNKFEGIGQPGNGSWLSVSMGNDGEYIAVASPDTENIVISTDYGTTWNINAEPETAPWSEVSFSPDGATLAAIQQEVGSVYISENQGAAWFDAESPTYAWTKIAAGNNGNVIISADSAAPVYVRKDSGDGFTWNDTGFNASGYITVDISGDGQRLALAQESGYVYLADAAGETSWTGQDSGSAPGIASWTRLAMSDDGSKVFVAGNSTGVWAYDASLADLVLPTVLSTSPANGSLGASIDAPLVVTFSEPMYHDLEIITDSCDTDCPTYDQSWSDDSTEVTLTRTDAAFQYDTEYTISIIGADEAFNVMADPYVWSFRTRQQTASVQPSNSSHPARGTSAERRIKNLLEMQQNSAFSDIQKIRSDMSFGVTGGSVTVLQNFLIQQGKGPASSALKNNGTTEYFGKLTKAALAEWQRTYGILPATGNFGPKTRAKIEGLAI